MEEVYQSASEIESRMLGLPRSYDMADGKEDSMIQFRPNELYKLDERRSLEFDGQSNRGDYE